MGKTIVYTVTVKSRKSPIIYLGKDKNKAWELFIKEIDRNELCDQDVYDEEYKNIINEDLSRDFDLKKHADFGDYEIETWEV